MTDEATTPVEGTDEPMAGPRDWDDLEVTKRALALGTAGVLDAPDDQIPPGASGWAVFGLSSSGIRMMDWTIRSPGPVIGEWPYRVDPATVVCRDVVECDPVPWARAGRGRMGQSFTPKRVKDHEQLVAWRLIAACRRAGVSLPIHDPLGLIAFFFVKTRARRDRDNFLKAIQDAGNVAVWHDDAQIVEGFERIFWDPDRPRTELLVYRATA